MILTRWDKPSSGIRHEMELSYEQDEGAQVLVKRELNEAAEDLSNVEIQTGRRVEVGDGKEGIVFKEEAIIVDLLEYTPRNEEFRSWVDGYEKLIKAKSPFILRTIKRKFIPELEERITKMLQNLEKIHFIVSNESAQFDKFDRSWNGMKRVHLGKLRGAEYFKAREELGDQWRSVMALAYWESVAVESLSDFREFLRKLEEVGSSSSHTKERIGSLQFL